MLSDIPESIKLKPNGLNEYNKKLIGRGRYWSRIKPTGCLQATLDLAIDPEWGNQIGRWIEITVPAGTELYEGAVSEIMLKKFNLPAGSIMGGGNQVFINTEAISTNIMLNWITNTEKFL